MRFQFLYQYETVHMHGSLHQKESDYPVLIPGNNHWFYKYTFLLSGTLVKAPRIVRIGMNPYQVLVLVGTD